MINNKKGIYPTISGTWAAYIYYNKELHYLGCFPTLEEAVEAREKAEIKKNEEKERKTVNYDTLHGITKRGGKWRINVGANGKVYYLGTAGSIKEAKNIRNKALLLIERNLFEEWYQNRDNAPDKEKYVSYSEAGETLGVSKEVLLYNIIKLGIEPLRHNHSKYISINDFEKIKAARELARLKKNTIKKKKVKSVDGKRVREGKDITGKQVHFLTAVKPTGKKRRAFNSNFFSYVWVWRCICGKEFEMPLAELTTRRMQSCGCKRFETRKKAIKKNAKKIGYYKGTAISILKKIKKPRSNSSTGVTGVSLQKKTGKYIAYISVSKKRYTLGAYDTLEEAKKARLKAEKKYFAPLIREYKKKLIKK
jgi:hypothetical protein